MKLLDVSRALGSSTLLGLLGGKKGKELLSAALPELRPQDMLVLDLSGMELITASAGRESIVALCRELAETGTTVALRGGNEQTIDELSFAAEASKVPLLVLEQAIDGEQTRGRVIGLLEPKQRETLEIVARLGQADAKTACEHAGDSSAGVTAWNNRLAGLASKGLLRERRSGKTKFYSLAMEGMVDGN